MNPPEGAHCLFCLGDGPDIIVTPEHVAGPVVPFRLEQAVSFTCDGCHRRWHWRVTTTPEGSTYALDIKAQFPDGAPRCSS